jgi:cobyrinic acid a,c-diamide synthase
MGSKVPRLVVAGLFANRIGSRGHLELLQSACLHAGAPPVVGGLPARPALAFPERHLGLHTATRDVVDDDALDAWAALFDEWCDAEALVRLAAAAPPLNVVAPGSAAPAAPCCRIGLGRDAAFHFYYDDNLRRLEALGAELVPFSPIAGATLPAVDGVILGGGYPELHAEALAANRPMRDSLRAFAAAGGPIYAECGGLMYLADGLRTLDGRTHEMVGLVRGTAVMHDRLQALGYVELETQRRTILGGAGLRLRGHQFRYSTLDGGSGNAYRVRRRRGDATSLEGYGAGNVLGSYVHVHWASNPLAAVGLVEACARFARARRP